MRSVIIILAGCALATWALADTKMKPALEAANQTRAPIPAAGAPTDTLTITAASDASTQLSADTVYSIVCTTDTRIRWGSSTPTAVGTDLYLKAGVIMFWSTDALQGRYVAGIRNAADGTCQINAWR